LIEIINNTFVNNNHAIHLERSKNRGNVNFANNLFVGSPTVISVAEKFSETSPVITVVREDNYLIAKWYQNVVYSNEQAPTKLPDQGWNFTVVENVLNVDPLIEKSISGTYVLNQQSPVIDAGTPLQTFSFQGRDYDPWVPGWMKDGNLDGVVLPDIGAFEYSQQ